MSALDISILFAYLALLVGIGVYAQRRKPDAFDNCGATATAGRLLQ